MNHQNDYRLGRRRIEAQLVEAGWVLQSASSQTLGVDSPLAVREYPTADGRIDYALYASDRVLGIVKATLDGESTPQGLRDARGQSRLTEQQPRYQGKYGVPFLYSTDGLRIDFLDIRRQQNQARVLSAFHTPDALKELADRNLDAELSVLQDIPLSHTLRDFQVEAIHAMESAIAAGHRKMVLSMATGTGKTITIVSEIYRLMRAGIARRVLLLQDSVALVAQTAQVFSSLEVEPGLSLETVFPVYSSLSEMQAFASTTSGAFSLKEAPFVQISTVRQVATLLREGLRLTAVDQDQVGNERPGLPIHTFDLIIAEDLDRPRSQPDRASLRQILNYFDAIKIGISSTVVFDDAEEFDKFVVYSYDFNAAVRDGSLVEPEAVKTRPTIRRWRTPTSYDNDYSSHDVFLSYAHEDAPDAALIAQSLREYGVNVRPANYDIPSDEYLYPQILNELRSQDTFVILLSPASIDSPWVENQLDAVLERRGVEVIPALLKPCPVPRSIADRTVVDVSSGVQGLVDCLEANARINLKALSPQPFESLTLELLRRLYFDIDAAERAHDRGYDFHGVFQDALGFADPTEYLIEVKTHTKERSSVNTLQAIANIVASDERNPRGLLVTNSQLTSIAVKHLARINDGHTRLVVIDGLKFKNILLRYPDLITKYFPAAEVAHGSE